MLVATALVAASAVSCGGGSGGGGSAADDLTRSGIDAANTGCDGSCPNQNLTTADVDRIIRQAVAGAQLIGVAATIAVTDRVGNVLGVYQMPGAPQTTVITTTGADGSFTGGGQGGLVGLEVPATFAAISKAGTGAYLSSQGNAFGTRTASQIIQQNFNPGEGRQAGGPLFGVQFSQLLCSDTNNVNPDLAFGLSGVGPQRSLARGLVGPRPLPLGLSADSGGIPIYKAGDPVGGIGVEFNGRYTLDPSLVDFDDDPEERVAMQGTVGGFETPSEIAANQIFVLGKSLRLTDLRYSDLEPLPAELPPLDPASLVAVPGFAFPGIVRAGAVFGDPSSGVARTTRAGLSTATLVDDAGNERFPARNGAPQGGLELTVNEVNALLDSAMTTANRARAGIRNPRDSQVHLSAWVVDINGTPLGFARTSDGPVFGIDVSLQKARTAVLFSSADARDALLSLGPNFGQYVTAAQALLGPDALTGTHAFADRSGGNLSRPFFPDGVNGNPPGPFSKPFPGSEFVTDPNDTWSPFNTGLQADLVIPALANVLFNGFVQDDCVPGLNRRVNNGIQIFPGSVPLYRNGVLIGGFGMSGDGIDQDDLVAFYSASRNGLDFIGRTDVGDPVLGFNAPPEIRADRIELSFPQVRLRYVNCPEAPFRGSNEQNVCENN